MPLPARAHLPTLPVSERMEFRVHDLRIPDHKTPRHRRYPYSRVASLRASVFHRRELRRQTGEDTTVPIRTECSAWDGQQVMFPQQFLSANPDWKEIAACREVGTINQE